MPNPQKIIVIGKFASPFGVQGWIKVASFTDPPENIFNYLPWKIRLKNKIETLKLAGKKIHDNGLIVQITDINDRDLVRQYTGAEIIIERQQLPPLPPDEYYWTDLEGMEVITTKNQILGKVDHVFATGSNDVLVVEGEKRHLIPFLRDQVVVSIDPAANTIRVEWDPEF